MPLTNEQKEAIRRAVVEDRFDDFLILREIEPAEPAALRRGSTRERRQLRANRGFETMRLVGLIAQAAGAALRDAKRPALTTLLHGALHDLIDRLAPIVEIVEETEARVFSDAARQVRDDAYVRWWADAAEVIPIDREAWATVRRQMDEAHDAQVSRGIEEAYPLDEVGWYIDDSLRVSRSS